MSTSQPALILASASPRRSELLRGLGLTFRVLPANTDEIQPPHLSPSEICQINALRKARHLAREHPQDWILGADTLVFLGSRIFGKPASRSEAHQMLRDLQGRQHHVITGVCLIQEHLHHTHLFAEITHVQFRTLTEAQIESYHQQVNPLDKAGAYAIQEHGDQIVEAFTGSLSNVIGLPVERLKQQWLQLPGWAEFWSALP